MAYVVEGRSMLLNKEIFTEDYQAKFLMINEFEPMFNLEFYALLLIISEIQYNKI